LKNLELNFGASADSIEDQISTQGLKWKHTRTKAMPDFQVFADAITKLDLHHVLSDSEVHKARKRLMKSIVRSVNVAHTGKSLDKETTR